jgi:hypothetical protein
MSSGRKAPNLNFGAPSGPWSYLGRQTLAVAGLEFTFPGINIDLAAMGGYWIDLNYTAANGSELHLQVNGDTTAGNYFSECWRYLTTTNAPSAFNTKLSDINSGADCHFDIKIGRLQSGKPWARSLGIEFLTTPAIQDREAIWVRNNTANVSGVGAIRLLAINAGHFPINAYADIYGMSPHS